MANPDNPNVTGPPTTSSKTLKSNKSLIVFVIFLGLALLSITGLYIFKKYTNHRTNPTNNKTPVATRQDPQQALKSATEFDKSIVSVDELIATHNYDGALKILMQYEPNITDPAQLYAVRGRLGSVFYDKKDYLSAIAWFEKAQQTGQPGADSLVVNIAIAAEKLGDKSKAIANYRQAIELLKSHPDSSTDSAIQIYQGKINNLGG